MFEVDYYGTKHGLDPNDEQNLVHAVVLLFGGYGAPMPKMIDHCVRRVGRGLNLSDKMVAILHNVVRSRHYSLTIMRVAQGALGPSHSKMAHAQKAFDHFGALTSDQVKMLFDAIREWLDEPGHAARLMLSKSEIEAMDEKANIVPNWAKRGLHPLSGK